jgi:hypothetical protein
VGKIRDRRLPLCSAILFPVLKLTAVFLQIEIKLKFDFKQLLEKIEFKMGR